MVFLPSSEATLNFVNYSKYFPDIKKKRRVNCISLYLHTLKTVTMKL